MQFEFLNKEIRNSFDGWEVLLSENKVFSGLLVKFALLYNGMDVWIRKKDVFDQIMGKYKIRLIFAFICHSLSEI